MAISKLPVYGNSYFASSARRSADVQSGAPSRFDELMASGSRPISGTIMSVGSNRTPAYYRDQATREGVDSLVRGDLGIDEFGNPAALEPLTLPAAPTYTAPVVDENAIDDRTHSKLAPMLSKLRNALNRSIITNKNVDNVNVRKELTRGAQRGYGEGLSSATASARDSGRKDYMATEYQPKVRAADMNFQAETNRNRMIAQDMINRRMAAMQQAYSKYRT